MNKRPEVKIGINHQPVKEYENRDNKNSRLVHLSNDDNFEILLYNPLTKTVGVKIELNGSILCNSYIVLQPGQSFWLDSNPDTHKKFHFTEYTVEANKDNLEAIADNGKVKVEFYTEYEKPMPISNQIWVNPIIYDLPTGTDPYWYTTCADTAYMDSNYTGHVKSINTASNYFTDISDSNFNMQSLNNKKFTGRINYKNDSSQRFSKIDINFNMYPEHTIEFQILPKANQILATEIKSYCSNCGRRARKNENFCPKCGNKL